MENAPGPLSSGLEREISCGYIWGKNNVGIEGCTQSFIKCSLFCFFLVEGGPCKFYTPNLCRFLKKLRNRCGLARKYVCCVPLCLLIPVVAKVLLSFINQLELLLVIYPKVSCMAGQ